MAGTESMDTMSRISELQPMSQDTMSILDRAGSNGNSTISRPVEVRPPRREKQTQTFNGTVEYREREREATHQHLRGRASSQGHHTCVVQGPKDPELIHGVEHVVFWGWVHEVELQQVLHPKGLEQQHHVGQVGPLDLGHRGGQEFILVGTLRVQPGREKTLILLHLHHTGLRGLLLPWLPTGPHGGRSTLLQLHLSVPHKGQELLQTEGSTHFFSPPPIPLTHSFLPTQKPTLPTQLFCLLHTCFISGTKVPETRTMARFYFLSIFVYTEFLQ